MRFEVFEGPLELLLHLVEKEKLSLFDIPITLLLEQYMAYIEEYKEQELDNISEFLVVAAQLLYIKSRMLLPPEEAEEEDPRTELADMLEEYKKYKAAAQALAQRKEAYGERLFTRAPAKVEHDAVYTQTHPPEMLSQAYSEVFKKGMRRLPPPIDSFAKIVGRKPVSVTGRVMAVLRSLLKKKVVSFKDIIYSQKSKSAVVATLLAVLELSMAGRIKFRAAGGEGDFKIELARGVDKDGYKKD